MSLRASIGYIGVRAIAGTLSVCSLALFVRGLGAEQYAHLVLGMAAAALAATLLVIPLNTTLSRLYGDIQLRPRIFATVLTALLSLGGLLLIVALVAEWLDASWLAPWVLPAAAFFAVSQGLLDIASQHANSTLEARRYARLVLMRAVGVIVFGALAIHFSKNASAVLLAMALACLVSLAVNMHGRLSLRGADAGLAPRVASFALPLLVTCSFSYVLQWGDRYLLMRYVPLAELGRYSALADLTQQTLVLVCSGLGAAWYPRIVEAWGAGRREEAQRLLSRYALIGIALVLPAAVGFSFLLAPVAALLFGQGYTDLPPALPLLLVAAAVVGGSKSFYFDVSLLLAERVWRLAAGIGLSAGVSLAVMLWALPRYGISGAAIGLLCGQTCGVGYGCLMGRGVLLHRLGAGSLLSVLAASAAMGLVLWAWQPAGVAGLGLRFVSGVLAYAFVLLAVDFDGVRGRLRTLWRGRR